MVHRQKKHKGIDDLNEISKKIIENPQFKKQFFLAVISPNIARCSLFYTSNSKFELRPKLYRFWAKFS